MTTFDETQHPRETTGKFATKTFSAPDDVLQSEPEESTHVPTPEQSAAAAMEAFHVVDGDVEEVSASFIEGVIAEEIRADRARRALTVEGLRRQSIGELLQDATTMGGDEIRDLDDRTLRHLNERAVESAARIQSYADERGLNDDSRKSRRVVDYADYTENDFADSWSAARRQLGAEGAVRTKADFVEQVRHARTLVGEADEPTERELDEHTELAWQYYLTQGASHEELDWGVAEFDQYQASAEESSAAVADGWRPDPWAPRRTSRQR